jgi:predicted transcriptional regulator
MADLLTPQDIERLADKAGVTMASVCKLAGVAPSIFTRWKAGKTEPNMESYRRIRDAALALPKRSKRAAARPVLPDPPAPAEAAE